MRRPYIRPHGINVKRNFLSFPKNIFFGVRVLRLPFPAPPSADPDSYAAGRPAFCYMNEICSDFERDRGLQNLLPCVSPFPVTTITHSVSFVKYKFTTIFLIPAPEYPELQGGSSCSSENENEVPVKRELRWRSRHQATLTKRENVAR